jgi:PAS domain S-box-containing protein
MEDSKNVKMILTGVMLGVLFWFLDSIIDAYVFNSGDIARQIFHPTPLELWIRLFVSGIILIFIFMFIQRRRAEEALQQSEKKYRMLIENIQDGVFIIQDAKLQYVNEAFARTAGYTSNEIIGKDFREFVAPEDLEMVADRYYRRQAGENVPSEYEFRVMRKDGTRVVVDMNAGLITYRGRVASIGILKDITGRKQIEEKLREGERFLESIFASIQDGIGILDKEMNIIRTNPTAEKWYPHAVPFAGKKCYEAYHGRSERCEFCPAWRTLETGKSAYEVVPKHGSGGKEVGWLEIYSFPMIDTTTGQMKGVIEYVRDITGRKRAEEALKLFSEAVENAPDGVQITDTDGHIIYSNKAVEEIYGFSPEEFKGKHVNEMNVDPEFASKVILPRIKETGRWVGELMVKHKNGRGFPISLNASLVKNSKGEPIAMVGIIRDITERKLAEEAITKYSKELEESNRMKELFTDIMHHDLLNPLSISRSYVELLSEKETSPSKIADLEIIGKNLTKGMELIESATMLSKLESLERIEFEELDLKNVIKKVIENFGSLAEKSDMKIENNVTQSMPVRANKIIEVVFNNFISNAVKYAIEGKRIVVEGEENEDSWRIKVTDFGEGIRDSDKAAIFERFQRMEKKGVKGSGLGLAIAKRIVELHNDRIWVEDNPEGGTIFVAEIPKST